MKPQRLAELAAPQSLVQAAASWRCVDFISDLHLQDSQTSHASQTEAARTFEAWRCFMQTTPADAVFILGDLFEVWVGDDVLAHDSPDLVAHRLAHDCVQVLQQAAKRCQLFFIHGNRDFLLGTAFAQSSAVRLLADPCVLEWAGARWLLSHGDALCLSDHDYMAFRAQVRSPAWQNEFLRQPLAQRQAGARALRAQSQARQRVGVYAQVDADLAAQWLRLAQAHTLIHGHTHQPGQHALPGGLQRVVLSDWDLAAPVPRADVLRLCRNPGLAAATLQRINLAKRI